MASPPAPITLAHHLHGRSRAVDGAEQIDPDDLLHGGIGLSRSITRTEHARVVDPHIGLHPLSQGTARIRVRDVKDICGASNIGRDHVITCAAQGGDQLCAQTTTGSGDDGDRH